MVFDSSMLKLFQKESNSMNGNVELLNYIYQNSQMGTDTIEQLLNKVEE